jgi:hypothetical protein
MLHDIIKTLKKLGFPGWFVSIDSTGVKRLMHLKYLKWKAAGKEGELA